jgi:MFS family permease
LLGGAVLVGAIGWRRPLGRSIAAAQTLTGLAFLGLLGPPAVPWIGATLVVAGLFASMLTAWAQTVRMRLIPPELRGRVFALLRTLMQSTPPIGAVIAGFTLGSSGSFGPVVLLMAALAAVPGVIGLVAPALGSRATAEPPAVTGVLVRTP